MIHSNKGKLYSALIIVVLILAIGVTVLYGESKQAKLKKENLKIAEEITDTSKKEASKEKDNTSTPDNTSENNPDTEEEKLVYSKENINVRSGPGTNHSILGSLPAYKRVTLIEKGTDGWSKIIFNDKEAYCNSSYLIEEEI